MRALGPIVFCASLVAALALTTDGSGAPAQGTTSSACATGTVSALIGGKRVCLKVGIRCERKHQAQYVRRGFSCNARGRLVPLRCTGGSVYGVIGGVHGCLREGQVCR